ncbi:isocitrate lyase/PEP mutase family protein [Patulibacter defluvii]|uniref:isocitrate lyase/PEP mutase family protein n=1 Tax=Patulibacter defluvii TaxID=3095358 RepID=UPI002A7516F3|nr:isocitrate lyase/phosphoenolpyruvate mutase family protein [Patulibacter sp. DM4]
MSSLRTAARGGLAERAARLRALHAETAGRPLVLPSVWDAASARAAVAAGFPAVATASAAVAASLGRPDREGVDVHRMLDAVGAIAAAVDVPVTADLESGYGLTATALVDGLLDVGAVGLNLEDSDHGAGGRLRSPAEQQALLSAVRGAADDSGIGVVLNGRCDLLLHADGDPGTRIDRTIERLRGYAEAGADVLYPIGSRDPADLRRLVDALPRPVNAIAEPGDDLAALAATGVRRITFGPYLQRATMAAMADLLAPWRRVA